MERVYDPTIPELDDPQVSEQVGKFCLLTDTETFRLVVSSMKTALINDVLFNRGTEVNDQFFRGTLNGIDMLHDFVHHRAELERNDSLTKNR